MVLHQLLHQVLPSSVCGVLLSSVLCLCSLYLCLFKWRRRHLELLASKMKGPPALPFIGNGLEFLGDPEHVMSKILSISNRYEDPFRVWIGPILLIVLANPEDIQIVLNSSKALEKDPLYRFFRNTVGTGLFSAPVEKWRRNRRLITPAFNAKLLEQFVTIFNDQNRILVGKLHERVGQPAFDLFEPIGALALDIICLTALGVGVDAQENPESEFALALPRVSEIDYMRIYKFWLHPDFIFNHSYASELRDIYKQLHGLPNKVIQEKKANFLRLKKERELNPDTVVKEPKLKVFIDILLELSDAGANFTDSDLRDEVVTMMIGGSETTALTNSFCLLMIAVHQDIQAKVYEEVYSVFGDSDRGATSEDLGRLVYTEMVIKETLRRWPVGPIFLRQLKENLDITNYTLPAGCSVAIAPIRMHMKPELYPEPHKFDPDRFLPELVEARHRYAYIPFSGGPRGCIGSKYAMLSMKTTISTVVRNFKVLTDVKMEDIKLKVDLLLRSVHGFKVTLEPRQRATTMSCRLD